MASSIENCPAEESSTERVDLMQVRHNYRVLVVVMAVGGLHRDVKTWCNCR